MGRQENKAVVGTHGGSKVGVPGIMGEVRRVLKGVHHRVSRDMDPICWNALGQEVFPCFSSGSEVMEGQDPRQPSEDLFRKRIGIGQAPMAASEPGLHMTDPNLLEECTKGAKENASGVSLDQNQVGAKITNHLSQPVHAGMGYVVEVLPWFHDAQVVGGLHLEGSEDLVHEFVVLAGEGQTRLHLMGPFVEGPDDRGHFDGLRPGPYHRQDPGDRSRSVLFRHASAYLSRLRRESNS